MRSLIYRPGRLLAPILTATALLAADAVVITVHPESPASGPFLGMGVQWDPHEYQPTPDAWKTIVDRVDYMKPGLLRVMLNAGSYVRGFDESDAPRFEWAGLASLLPVLDYAQSRNIDVLIGEWSPARGLNTGSGRVGPADPHWAKVHAGFLKFLIDVKKYTVIRYFNFMNEPNGSWMWPGGNVDYAAWAQGIRNLRQELDAQGLSGIRIAGPDNSGNWNWLDRCAADLPHEFGAWEMHWYAKDAEVLEGRIETLLAEKRKMLRQTDAGSASKPLFIGEAGMIDGKTNGDQQPRVKEYVYGVLMADYVAQVARAGWQSAVAWDLDDAMHVNTGPRVNPPAERTLKIWGFWNTQGPAMGHPEDMAVRPWYYSWSLLSRLLPKGARMVPSEAGAALPGLRTLAAIQPGGTLSVMVVNDNETARIASIRAPRGGRKSPELYRYFDKELPPASKTLPPADLNKGISIDLPSRGVVFLVFR